MYAPEIKLFQFPIGKVQRENDSFWTQERIEKFQFLIGKVQLLLALTIRIMTLLILFQFLIGKVQHYNEGNRELELVEFQFLIGKVQQQHFRCS